MLIVPFLRWYPCVLPPSYPRKKRGIQTCPWQGTGGDRYHAGLQPWVPRLRGCNPTGACTGGADASPFGANGDGAPAVIPAQARRRPGSMVPQASEFTCCFVDPVRSEATVLRSIDPGLRRDDDPPGCADSPRNWITPSFAGATEMARVSCLFDLYHRAAERRSLRGEKQQLGVAAARGRDTKTPC
jgi:hypothetical protein